MTRGEILATVFWIVYDIGAVVWGLRVVWRNGFERGRKSVLAPAAEPKHRTPIDFNNVPICAVISTGPITLDLEGTTSQLVTPDGPAAHISLDDLLNDRRPNS